MTQQQQQQQESQGSGASGSSSWCVGGHAPEHQAHSRSSLRMGARTKPPAPPTASSSSHRVRHPAAASGSSCAQQPCSLVVASALGRPHKAAASSAALQGVQPLPPPPLAGRQCAAARVAHKGLSLRGKRHWARSNESLGRSHRAAPRPGCLPARAPPVDSPHSLRAASSEPPLVQSAPHSSPPVQGRGRGRGASPGASPPALGRAGRQACA